MTTTQSKVAKDWPNEKEVLGLWIAQTEGAKFWLAVVTEFKNRGVADIFNCLCRWLKGFGFGRRNAA